MTQTNWIFLRLCMLSDTKVLALFLMIFLGACSDKESQDSDSGMESWNYPGGSLSRRGYIENGLPEGVYRWYHENGVLAHRAVYVDGLREGIEVYKYPSGALHAVHLVREGQITGTYGYWFEDGGLCYVSEYKNGQQNGLYRQYHPNGEVAVEGVFEDGEEAGFILRYDDINRLCWLGYFVTDRHGRTRTIYEEGENIFIGSVGIEMMHDILVYLGDSLEVKFTPSYPEGKERVEAVMAAIRDYPQ